MDIQPVILSGGSGSRLWPLSRQQHPKQLLSIGAEHTLVQATALRLAGIDAARAQVRPPIVVCNEEYRLALAEQLRQVGLQAGEVLLEPEGRSTAPALTLAALACLASGGDCVLLVMPADHVITETAPFLEAVLDAAQAAASRAVVALGVVPERAETGYGYIRTGPSVGPEGRVRRIASFIEKPDIEGALHYVNSGEYFWNSGIFVLTASTWHDAIERLRPDILAACTAAYRAGRKKNGFYHLDAATFRSCPSDSIDYAVMERLPDAVTGIESFVVPVACGWSDVGSWDAVWEAAQKDANGNVVQGDVMLQDSHNSLVLSKSRMVAGVGLEDIVLVETADAVMVARKSHTQDVKTIVERLKADKRSEANTHRKVHRPWGSYECLDSGDRFQVKRIIVTPGGSLSLQMHHHRAEHWVVVRGTARVTRGEETFLLSENQSAYIPLGTTHRLENPGMLPLEIIEVQSGPYLGEDDIVRFEDVYGR